MNELSPQGEKMIDLMGEYIFDRFMVFIEQEDHVTSKALMDEWIVDGVDPEDGEVEFMTLNKIEEE
tara:strand:+ start:720 stop:917 length:198 start_codon:yes stop_codon:yes gene_type:complete